MQSIEEIYKNHANMIFKYLMSLCGNQHIAEELTQETFYQAIKCINNVQLLKLLHNCPGSSFIYR